jgi:hypothetical protein
MFPRVPTLRVGALAAFVAVGIALAPAAADAAPKPKKYHFEVSEVTARPEVAADVAAIAQPRVKAQIDKAFASHDQLVFTLDGAPDPKTSAEAYRKYIERKGLSGSFLVTIEITEASQALEAMPDRPKEQRLTVHLALHTLGEAIPGRTMGFTGDGTATIKIEIGKTLRDKDRDYAWDQAAELAVADAIKTSLAQLDKPQKKQ